MLFNYDGDDQGLRQACSYCAELGSRQEFWDRVVENGPYDYSDVTSQEIASYMRNHIETVEIRFFTGRLRYRKTVAYVSPSRANVIFYNTRFLGNAISRKVNTLVHEFVHVTDYFGDSDRIIEYGHGNQSSEGKGKSAPYAIGQIAEEFYKSDHPSFIKGFAVEPLDFECDLGDLPEDQIVDNV